jgi:tetratricopeptide (TPR) repeat protein
MRHCYWAAIGALLCCFATVSAEDQLYRKGMGSERGVVTDMSKAEVTLTVSGVKRQFPANEIQRITFEGEPSDLSQARTTILTTANYKAALEELKKIDLKKINMREEFIKQEVDFYRALCQGHLALTEGGEKTAAENALRQFCTDHKESYHFYPAAELAGDVAAAAGRYADAAKYYNAVASAPWDETRIRANVALGRMLSAQGKFPEALERYDAVAKDVDTAETGPLKQQAIVGRAMCLAETGKPDEAIALIVDPKGVINTNDPKDSKLMARAYNALGTAYAKASKKKEAILAFLHTDLLYFQDPDAHAEALYNLANLFQETNKSDRSLEARNTLKQRYAGSVWETKK